MRAQKKDRMDNVSVLLSMGFPQHLAVKALQQNNDNLERATNWLLYNSEAQETMEVEEDADLAFARKLQEEENRKQEPKVHCQLTGKAISLDKLYILDECSCKFEKEALIAYVTEAIKTQVDVKCGSKNCNASISVRDMKELMPQSNKQGLAPAVSSKQATQRIAAELKHILKTNPKQQVQDFRSKQ
eukprot:TRINITY_DN1015_c0_g1_i1.p1 TRINITY_DN1015_c0_g1~~TRINITY_DN1015_c0_g1_i1.p1  ORF type:complete len:187 (-),score=37.18 TRINITY_DN1015_c0_g1_i1:522-1082(-)